MDGKDADIVQPQSLGGVKVQLNTKQNRPQTAQVQKPKTAKDVRKEKELEKQRLLAEKQAEARRELE